MPRISGEFITGCFADQWVVQYAHLPNGWNYTCKTVIVAYCDTESEAKDLKRKLQNSLNNQKRNIQKLGAVS
jgi:hypothetical protein